MKNTSRLSKLFLVVLLLSSCRGEWTQKDKDRITKDCRESAIKYGFSNPDEHCKCVLQTIMTRYPNSNQFENLEMGEFGTIMMECQGKVNPTRIIWPERTQKAFVDSCSKMAAQMGKQKPRLYCECVLKNLMQEYPTNDDLRTISAKVMAKMSADCEESVGK